MIQLTLPPGYPVTKFGPDPLRSRGDFTLLGTTHVIFEGYFGRPSRFYIR